MVVTTAMNQSGTARWPAGQNCVCPHFAGKTVQTYWGLDLTRPLQVSSGIWHQVWFFSESRLVCPAPSTEPQTEIWIMWRPHQHVRHVTEVLKHPWTILVLWQDEATALREYCFSGFSLASVSLGLWSLFLGTLLKLLTWSSDPIITVWLLSNSPKSSHWCPFLSSNTWTLRTKCSFVA